MDANEFRSAAEGNISTHVELRYVLRDNQRSFYDRYALPRLDGTRLVSEKSM